MRLKRLELFGFKSFADRTVLDFAHSLVGIVGPNGCGKSNIVDAIRWVLGEQRPTSMRGGEMTDVIFKGSVSRPSLSVAEVTMVLDNACGTLEAHGSEVGITRRVFQSGEGEYLLDGEQVRLKDIREMLFNTGLGSRGYAVLEQGKIDAVLSANPIERRTIFEEAAGISRYRQRRKEAESQLRRVGRDTERLDDIIAELEKRVRSLKIQAGKAQRYIEAREEWRERGLTLLRHELHITRTELGELVAELERREEEAARLRKLRGESEHDINLREEEQGSLEGEVERLGTDLGQVTGDLRALDERTAQLSARISSWLDAAAEEARRHGELVGKFQERQGEHGTLQEQTEGLRRRVVEIDATVSELAGRSRELRRQLTEAREQSEQQNQSVLGLLHDKTAANNAIHHLEQALEPLRERAARAQSRLSDSRETRSELQRNEEKAILELEQAETDVAREEQRRRELEADFSRTESRVEKLTGERNEMELESTRLKSRIESLLDWDREREGLDSGAQTLLASAESGHGPELARELGGLLADHLQTPTLYARALDAVLGDRAQAIVVSDPEDARRIVGWLKEQRKGLVRLVLPGALENRAPREVPESLLQRTGGRLLDHVRAEAGFERLAEVLLGDVLLARDLDQAFELSRQSAGDRETWRFATPEGDVVDADGVMGGHREVAQGAVGRRSHAAELDYRARQVGAGLAQLGAEIGQLFSQRDTLRGARERTEAELEAHRTRLAHANAAVESVRARLTDHEESVSLFEREVAGLQEESRSAETELGTQRTKLANTLESFEAANASLESLEQRRRELEEAHERASREEAAERIEATRIREQLDGHARRLADLERMSEETRIEMLRAERLSSEHNRLAADGQSEFQGLGGDRDRMLQRRSELEGQLTARKERERTGREAIEELRKRVDAVGRELEDLMTALAEKQLERQRLELGREDILRRSLEDFALEGEELMADFEPVPELSTGGPLEELRSAVRTLRSSLERLGNVNLEAVEELDQVEERLIFLSTQREDLAKSKSSLESTLRTINAESERLFLESFESIRENFRVIFRRLFGGGRADVQLAEDEPVLEAGIVITARPPGREMLPIGLLSGGQRTLTALALLFSVFQSRPSPFCVLDEVDAALDDANIARFLGMLDGFRRTTQFLLVTHNKGSMAACDMLYGITMQTKGVSNQVSVQLSEVDDFVPEATGDAQKVAVMREEGIPEEQASNGEAGSEQGEPERAGSAPEPESGPAERIVELVPAARRPELPTEGSGVQADESELEEEPVGEIS